LQRRAPHEPLLLGEVALHRVEVDILRRLEDRADLEARVHRLAVVRQRRDDKRRLGRNKFRGVLEQLHDGADLVRLDDDLLGLVGLVQRVD
jgi:hypothetical protein